MLGGAVELDHGLVERELVLGLHAGQRLEDLAVDRLDRLEHALAAVALLVAVAQLDRLVGAGGGAGRHRGAPEDAGFQHDVHLDGGIAAGIEDFTGDDIGDFGHGKRLRRRVRGNRLRYERT